MGNFLQDLLDTLFAPAGMASGLLGQPPPISWQDMFKPVGIPEAIQTDIDTPPLTPDEPWIRKDFLFWEAAVLGSIVAAPALYAAYTARRKGKRKKRDEKILVELNDASNRSVALLASIGPAIGFPIAYMTIQGLEARGVISKGLGNTVQTLMAGAVVGQAASSITGLIGAVKR